jgi:hypothetical protein
MQYRIEIQLDNAAFEENETGEVSRILSWLAAAVAGAELLGDVNCIPLRDINGNTVGQAYLESEV